MLIVLLENLFVFNSFLLLWYLFLGLFDSSSIFSSSFFSSRLFIHALNLVCLFGTNLSLSCTSSSKRKTRWLYLFNFFNRIILINYEKMSVLLIFFLCFMFFLMKLSYITCSICQNAGNVLHPVRTISVWQYF